MMPTPFSVVVAALVALAPAMATAATPVITAPSAPAPHHAPTPWLAATTGSSGDSSASAGMLTGVWTGWFDPAKPINDRYFLAPHTGAATSASTAMTTTTVYDVACVDVAAAKCAWQSGTATVSQSPDAPTTFNVTVKLSEGSIITGKGTVSGASGDTAILFDNGSTWARFSGALSGLWEGWHDPSSKIGDYYLMAHNASTGVLTVHCMDTVGPCSWHDGAGTAPTVAHGASCGAGASASLQLAGGAALSGSVSSNCSLISWAHGMGFWGLRQQQMLPVPVRSVHVVFMNHLDVGYNGISYYGYGVGFINNVVNTYFHKYFPKSIALSNAMRALGGTDRFIYTTHPWLVNMYLNCPKHLTLADVPLVCPNASDVAAFNASVARGDITWHAGPFNLQPENMSPRLFLDSLTLATDLDDAYGVPHKTTLSQRDVPFMTRGVVPLLSKAGVKAITVGTNGACAFPDVPKAFVWRDPVSATEVLAMEHPHGYGGITTADCVTTVTGVAMCPCFRTDNRGPPDSTDEVIKDLDTIRQEYPQASVFASTWDAFTAELEAAKASLPVYTGEVGDTWMYGAPSDPLKMAQYRALVRVRDACLDGGDGDDGRGDGAASCSLADPGMRNSTRFLIKPPEHTWGLPSTGDGTNWANDAFQSVRHNQNFVNCTMSWVEQRRFNNLAVTALADAGHPIAPAMEAAMASVLPSVPMPGAAGSGYVKASFPTLPIAFAGATMGDAAVTLAFGADGSIITLTDHAQSDTQWASPAAPLAQIIYQTFNDTSFLAMARQYMLSGTCNGSFCKPGSNNFTSDAEYVPTLTETWVRQASMGTPTSVVTVMSFPVMPHTEAGAPATAYLNVTLASGAGEPSALSMRLTWTNKTATRLGESIMFGFTPAPPASAHNTPDLGVARRDDQHRGDAGGEGGVVSLPGAWAMDKLGTPISPLETMQGGSQYQHGVWTGFNYTAASGRMLCVATPDAPVVSPMTAEFPHGNPMPYVAPISDDPHGMAVNLENQIWTTNYPQWYPFTDGEGDEDSSFRFTVTLR